MKEIQNDIDNIKQVNKENLVESILFGSYLYSPDLSNDIDLIFYVKNKKGFIIPNQLSNEVIRIQYNCYKSDNTIKGKKGLDILIIDNQKNLDFVKKYNDNQFIVI